MKEEVNKEDGNALCARCQVVITCLPNDISRCDCNKVKLTAEEYRYINSQYQECVCNRCLEDLKNEYHAKHHFNRPDNSIIRKYNSLFIGALLMSQWAFSQVYPPGVGQPGTTAMHKDSSAFVNWASLCSVERGFMDISDESLGLASAGDTDLALGKAQSNGVLSLGDGGKAICAFPLPIMDGPGPDFAVFENSFDDSFLELAFVEVSSDGQNFYRFPAHSLSDTLQQTASFGATDPTKLHHLAGKYRGGYGTPFDLADLGQITNLNTNAISHVRVVDVVGSISNSYASRDSQGRKINDPWPTPFPSGGFDLDAIGVIHENTAAGIPDLSADPFVRLWPNPVVSGSRVYVHSQQIVSKILVYDQLGREVLRTDQGFFDSAAMPSGAYILQIEMPSAKVYKHLVIL